MGDGIHISRVAERFSSHTQMRSQRRRHGESDDAGALRQRLIAAAVEALAAGGDPRLTKTLAHA